MYACAARAHTHTHTHARRCMRHRPNLVDFLFWVARRFPKGSSTSTRRAVPARVLAGVAEKHDDIMLARELQLVHNLETGLRNATLYMLSYFAHQLKTETQQQPGAAVNASQLSQLVNQALAHPDGSSHVWMRVWDLLWHDVTAESHSSGSDEGGAESAPIFKRSAQASADLHGGGDDQRAKYAHAIFHDVLVASGMLLKEWGTADAELRRLIKVLQHAGFEHADGLRNAVFPPNVFEHDDAQMHLSPNMCMRIPGAPSIDEHNEQVPLSTYAPDAGARQIHQETGTTYHTKLNLSKAAAQDVIKRRAAAAAAAAAAGSAATDGAADPTRTTTGSS